MPSRRIDWDRPPNRLSVERDRLTRAGRDLVDLTVSNPTVAGLSPSDEQIRRALDRPGLATYRPDPRGEPTAREAIAATYAHRGVRVDPDAVVVTPGTSAAYGYLLKLLADPDDVVLVPRPSYPLFDFLADLESVRASPYPIRYDGGWFVDVDAVRAAVQREPVRAVFAVHPNNPTGSFWRSAEVDAIVDACAAADAALVVDEVFAGFPLRDDPRRRATFAGETRVATFVIDGLSKSVALPQAKIGWIVVAGPVHERAATSARLDWILDTYLPVSAPVQRGVPAMLALGPAVRRRISERLARNLDGLRRRTAGSAASVLDVEGGWSAIVRLPDVVSSEKRALRLLDREGVLVHPGYYYDLAEEAHLVVSLLTPAAAFDRGVDAIVREANEPA